MHIRVASDLHLEGFFGQDSEALVAGFLTSDPRDAQATLVLAGDISSMPDQLVGFLGACLKRFSNVIFVPGNHEYYRHDFDAWNKTMEERLTLLGQECSARGDGSLYFSTAGIESVTISDVRFIFGTMWGDGGPTLADQAITGRYLNDFRLITKGQQRFTVPDMMQVFKSGKKEMERLLREPCDLKTVVVTHHLPSRRLVSDRFWPGDGSDGANGGFVGNCDDLLASDHSPALWIHGHTHDTIDTNVWKVRIVCNPAGYRGEWYSKFNDFMRTEDGKRVVIPKFIDTKEI